MKSLWSNETETVNFIEQVINPYVIDKRNGLGLPADQKAVLIWDVFRGQTTDHVAQILDSLHIKVAKVPANMTHLTVNGSAKNFMRKKFVTWYAEEIKKQMDAGIPAESIDVSLNPNQYGGRGIMAPCSFSSVSQERFELRPSNFLTFSFYLSEKYQYVIFGLHMLP